MPLEPVAELGHPQPVLLEEIEQQTRIDAAAARRHHEPVERRRHHRSPYARAITQRAHRRTAAQVGGELAAHFAGQGWDMTLVDVAVSDDPDHELAVAFERAAARLIELGQVARAGRRATRPRWPVVVVKSPKGWGTVESSGGRPTAGTFHAHHLPIEHPADERADLEALEGWLRSYRPEMLVDQSGRPHDAVLAALPPEQRRLGRAPAADGGRLRTPLPRLDMARYLDPAERRDAASTQVAARWLSDLLEATTMRRDFRIVCPHELTSIGFGAVFQATERALSWPARGYAEHVASAGRVLVVLNEHSCHGWLQGYLLSGRHGLPATYEAFAEVVTSMLNQHAKFLAGCAEVP